MNRLATTLGAAALLLAPLAAHGQTTSLWERNALNDATNFGTTGTERGFAYNPATNNVLLATSTGGTYRIVPLNGNTGTAGTALATAAIITGGFRILNDVEVASNGNIIACNGALAAAVAPNNFRCYRWDNEADTSPELIVNYVSPGRIGDKITVKGNTLYAATSGVAGSSTLNIFDLTTATLPMTTPTSQVTLGNYVSTSGAGGTGSNCDVAPTGTNYYLKCNGIGVQYYDLLGNQLGSIAGSIVASASNALEYYETADSSYLFVYQYGPGNENTRIVNTTAFEAAPSDVSTLSTTYSLTQSATTTNTNSTGLGDVAIRADAPNYITVYTLSGTNGVRAVQTTKAGLPVELVSFTAQASGNDAVVRWTTASETSNASFAIEALRGTAWTELATVAGRGTTSERADYETRLSGLGTGRHTLRLVQRDLDGTATVAGTVELMIGGDQITAELRGTSVRFGSPVAQALTVEAFDVLGRRVSVLFAGTVEAGSVGSVELSGVASGLYVVRVSGRTGVASTTAVVR